MQYHKGLIFILTIFFIISATSQAEILFKDKPVVEDDYIAPCIKCIIKLEIQIIIW